MKKNFKKFAKDHELLLVFAFTFVAALSPMMIVSWLMRY